MTAVYLLVTGGKSLVTKGLRGSDDKIVHRLMSSPDLPIRWGGLPRRITAQDAVLWVLLFSLFIASWLTPLCAEDAPSRRKPIYKVEPDYPPDLKRAYIGGIVRLNLLISPSGTVEEISVLGGNPVLAEAAVRAVKKWKYGATQSKSSTRVDFVFSPYK
jgi:TonB family protein